MGHGLDRITRGLKSKICINISEGKRWPEGPIESAKFASEGGITIRNHVPIFPHWKHYKDKDNEPEIAQYIGRLAVSHVCIIDLFKIYCFLHCILSP
jgi:hypothetical protein